MAKQFRPRCFVVFSAQPECDTLIQPPVEFRELLPCPGGIAIVVPPSDDNWVELVDEIGEGSAGWRFSHLGPDLVA